MPNDEALREPEGPSPRKARDETQLILGQIHGVVWLAANEAGSWLPRRETPDSEESELTADDLQRAAAEAHEHFGRVHAALNTGRYDEQLVRVGLAGAQGAAKRKGFLAAIARLFRPKRPGNYVAPLRGCLRWCHTLIGSIAAALKEEIERVPGAAAAGEAIKELIEVFLNATEPPDENQKTMSNRPKNGEVQGVG